VGIGRWVIEAACLQVVQWSSSPETSDWVVSVNVSAAQFRDAAFIDQVAEILLATGVDPSRLKIELTESVLFSDTEETIHRMNQLTHMGLAFALDDFGTGYSSLAYLKRLPLDQLKIDQSFVRDILVDPNDAAIAATIIALAEKLDLEVVAEGVETEEQMQLLVQQGCFRFQGYLFGKPDLPDVLQADALATHRPSVIKPGPAT
jgi:EAL domain-containing protein (putative c-di-GMP-specific phosphodiesterase class I)